jgi:hypothetical protein
MRNENLLTIINQRNKMMCEKLLPRCVELDYNEIMLLYHLREIAVVEYDDRRCFFLLLLGLHTPTEKKGTR